MRRFRAQQVLAGLLALGSLTLSLGCTPSVDPAEKGARASKVVPNHDGSTSAAAPSPSKPAPVPVPSPRRALNAEEEIIEGALRGTLDRQGQRVTATRAKIALYEAWDRDESQRWNPELRAAAQAATASPYASTKQALKTLIDAPFRAKGHAQLDPQRQPAKTFEFWQIKPTSTVVQIDAGAGWYSELLAPLLAHSGQLIVCAFSQDASPLAPGTAQARRTHLLLQRAPELYAKVKRQTIASWARSDVAPLASADVVLATEDAQEWLSGVYAPQVIAAAYRALKPGGTLGVILTQGEQAPNAKPAPSENAFGSEVRHLAEAAGFHFDASLENQGTKKKAAASQSDRMTLRFVKPEGPAPQP